LSADLESPFEPGDRPRCPWIGALAPSELSPNAAPKNVESRFSLIISPSEKSETSSGEREEKTSTISSHVEPPCRAVLGSINRESSERCPDVDLRAKTPLIASMHLEVVSAVLRDRLAAKRHGVHRSQSRNAKPMMTEA